MAPVFSMHEIELRPGITFEAFERFVCAGIAELSTPSGMKVSVFRGDRGERFDRYLFLAEFDSLEARDRLYPAPASPSEEMLRFLGNAGVQQFLGSWGTLATIPDQGTTYTDYVRIVAEA